MRKPTICICKNKDADQLRGNREADQRLCFRYMDSTLSLLLKSEISSLQPSAVTVQPDLCQTCLETTLLVFSRDGSFVKNEIDITPNFNFPFSENFDYLKRFLLEFSMPDRCRTILNWNLGGKVLLKYINICESMKHIHEVRLFQSHYFILIISNKLGYI